MRVSRSAGDKPLNVFKASSTLAPIAESTAGLRTKSRDATSSKRNVLVLIEAPG
jgi:hypothetical protein